MVCKRGYFFAEVNMKRWNTKTGDKRRNKKVDKFLDEVLAVCKKHGFSISHQDRYGAFEVTKHNYDFHRWLKVAHDRTED
jgi:hypothetical protein